MVDPAAGKVLSAKRYADLLMASARVDGERVVITLPDASEHAADDPDVHKALSDWLDLADVHWLTTATTIRDTNGNNLGVYATVTQSGTVRVGDIVYAS